MPKRLLYILIFIIVLSASFLIGVYFTNFLNIRGTPVVQNTFYTIKGEGNTIWAALEQKIDNKGNVEIFVYRKDWDEKIVNFYFNNILWKITRKPGEGQGEINLFEGSGQDPNNP